MKNKELENMLNLSAIICEHVAQENKPARLAKRTEPVEPEDSGWQILCHSDEEGNVDNAQIWLISEVLKIEPSLTKYISRPIGTILFRDNNDVWREL